MGKDSVISITRYVQIGFYILYTWLCIQTDIDTDKKIRMSISLDDFRYFKIITRIINIGL
jgi:hypothetical protein